MPQKIRSSHLETRTARLKLPIAKKPLFVRISEGVGLGYRRNRTDGKWVVRIADGKGENREKGFAFADDYQDANGDDVLTYDQASDRARKMANGDVAWGGGGGGPSGGPLTTVKEALDGMEADLKLRGGDTANVQRARKDLTPKLLDSLITQVKK